MLLAEGANSNVCRIDGASPLWIAAQMGHDHIVRILLKNGAYVDAVRCVSFNFLIIRWTNNKNVFVCLLFLGRSDTFVQSSTQRFFGCRRRAA